MSAELVIDTSAFVALINASERQHAACVNVLAQWQGQIVTTEAVLTETLYLVGDKLSSQPKCLEFFLRRAFLLVPTDQTSLARIAELMKKYSDLPMDYADATLVSLCEELETDQIFTLDRQDFSVYRLNGRKPFRILP